MRKRNLMTFRFSKTVTILIIIKKIAKLKKKPKIPKKNFFLRRWDEMGRLKPLPKM